MEQKDLLAQIAQMLEQQTQAIDRKLEQQIQIFDQKLEQQTQALHQEIQQAKDEIKQAIVKNNVAIGEVFEQALEPISDQIRDLQGDTSFLREDNAKNTLEIARLKRAK